MWRELINTTFEFFADDSLTFPEPGPELEPEPEPGRIEAWNYPEAQDTSMMEHVDADSIVDVELLIRSIPACGYCRSRHVKCDQKFPACGACTRSDRQCVYYDAVLEIDIPRR
jgi:hypothetical protein